MTNYPRYHEWMRSRTVEPYPYDGSEALTEAQLDVIHTVRGFGSRKPPIWARMAMENWAPNADPDQGQVKPIRWLMNTNLRESWPEPVTQAVRRALEIQIAAVTCDWSDPQCEVELALREAQKARLRRDWPLSPPTNDMVQWRAYRLVGNGYWFWRRYLDGSASLA